MLSHAVRTGKHFDDLTRNRQHEQNRHYDPPERCGGICGNSQGINRGGNEHQPVSGKAENSEQPEKEHTDDQQYGPQNRHVIVLFVDGVIGGSST